MKVKHYDIITCYKALNKMSEQYMPARISYALYRVKTKLKPIWDFHVEHENKLLEKYGESDGNDKWMIKDPDKRTEWSREMLELMDIEEEIDISPVCLEIPQDISMTVEQFESLNPFVNFID